MKTKYLTTYALLLALGVVLNYIEHLIPLPFVFPGVKLGLANSIGLIALYFLGRKSYVFLGLMRVLLSALLFTGFGTNFLISLMGTIFATIVTIIGVTFTKASIYGISCLGAVFHGLGQIVIVSIIYEANMFSYMLILAISGLITGLLMALASSLVIKRLPEKII